MNIDDNHWILNIRKLHSASRSTQEMFLFFFFNLNFNFKKTKKYHFLLPLIFITSKKENTSVVPWSTFTAYV